MATPRGLRAWATARPGLVKANTHRWAAFSRTVDYRPSTAIPIVSVSGTLAHVGVDKVQLNTTFTPERWGLLDKGSGILLYRDGSQLVTAHVINRQAAWDGKTGTATIQVQCVSEEDRLAKRLAFPDPLRAADDQTVNDYWSPRDSTGTPIAVPASTAMLQLISDQAGPTAAADRQIAGLVLGLDPVVGASRTWQAVFNDAGNNGVLDKLVQMSVASGSDLGIRFTSTTGTLTVNIVQPRDLSGSAIFSPEFGNLDGWTFTEAAPTVTHALAAGAGDLHARLRVLEVTTDPVSLSWGEQDWSYIDEGTSSDTTQLDQAALDAIAQGAATVNLTATLIDSPTARWRTDWDLGDKISIRVGLPRQAKIANVTDVVRQITFSVDSTGAEKITAAVGSYDAKAVIPTPTQKQLTQVGRQLAGLISRK